MSEEYQALVAENQQLKARAAELEATCGSLVSQLAALRYEGADLRRQLDKARKPKRVLDPNADSAFDRPYDGR